MAENKYKLSNERSLLVTFGVLTFIAFFVYLFAPSEVTQVILAVTVIVTIVDIFIFGIRRIGKKSW